MYVLLLSSVLLCLLPAFPIGKLRKNKQIAKIPKPALFGVITLLGVVPVVLASIEADTSLALPNVIAAFILMSYGASHAINLISVRLRKEAGKAFPKALTNKLKSYANMAWIARSALGLMSAVCAILILTYGALGWSAYALAVVVGLMAFAPLGMIWRKRKDLSDAIHASEVERFLSWADRNEINSLIHLPDGSAAAMVELDKLVKHLATKGIKAGILCRGKRSFALAQKKYGTTWLIRNMRDLDSYAVPPVDRCFHVPVGTIGQHMVPQRDIYHVLIDLVGALKGAEEVPKGMRMFDEVQVLGEPSFLLQESGKAYDIVVCPYGPDQDRTIFPRVPAGPVASFALIIPADETHGADLEVLYGAVPLIDAITKAYGVDYRLFIAFDDAPPAATKKIETWLASSLGKGVVHRSKSLVDALNSASYLISTPKALDYLGDDILRTIIETPADLLKLPAHQLKEKDYA